MIIDPRGTTFTAKSIFRFRTLLAMVAVMGDLLSHGQFSSASSKTLAVADVRNSTVYVLPTGNEVFDQALYDAVQENWTLSPIGNLSDIPGKLDLTIPGRLYIGYLDGGIRRSIALIRSGTDQPLHDLDKQDILAYCPMGSARNENTIEQCAYRIPLMVASLNQVIAMRIQQKCASIDARDLNRLGAERPGVTILAERALFRDEEVQSLMEVMGSKVQFVDRAEVEGAIEERRPGMALLVPVFGFVLDVIVYDLGGRECIYLHHTLNSWETAFLSRPNIEKLSIVFDRR